MLGRFSIITMFFLLIGSCQTRRSNRSLDDIADFSLSGVAGGVKVDDREYFDDLQRSESTIGFESSFPLPFAVGRAVDPYDAVPAQAKAPIESVLSFQYGPCRFSLKTGPIQVDRYLLAGQWIKLTEGLPSGVPVKLEPQQDLNVKIVTQLVIEIPESQKSACRKVMEGKRTPLGRFHMNRSKIGLLSAPNAPKIQFSSRSMEPKGKMVSVRWAKNSPAPMLLDDFDFPATCESGIFRALMGSKGFYHLTFQPALRMDNLDQMVIKIPYNGKVTAPAVAAPGTPTLPSTKSPGKATDRASPVTPAVAPGGKPEKVAPPGTRPAAPKKGAPRMEGRKEP